MNDIPIAALRSLRAVARCGSFTSASRDLGVAQSAISRHLATLESQLGQTLVVRGHRQARLTPAGELLLETADRVLDELDHVATRLSRADARQSVKILAMPAFAARWLVPRLPQLQAARIEVDIELSTSIWDSDFSKERFDFAVHYGDGAWPGARLLMQDSLVPVIAPRALAAGGVRRIEDLTRFCWLHDSLRSGKWRQWLTAVGAEALAGARNVKLQDTEACLTAAVAGVGIAIGHAVLVENDIREGRLVEVWPQRVPLAAGYHLLQSKRMARNAAAQRLVRWLVDEAAGPGSL